MCEREVDASDCSNCHCRTRCCVGPAPFGLVGASLPISALTAWQGLFEHGRLRAGQSVLAHGAAGSVGTMVTQLAREAGAYVIGTGRAAELLAQLLLSSSTDRVRAQALRLRATLESRSDGFSTAIQTTLEALAAAAGEPSLAAAIELDAAFYLVGLGDVGGALGVEAEPRPALLVGGDAVVGDEAGAGGDGEGGHPLFLPPPALISQSETSVLRNVMQAVVDVYPLMLLCLIHD